MVKSDSNQIVAMDISFGQSVLTPFSLYFLHRELTIGVLPLNEMIDFFRPVFRPIQVLFRQSALTFQRYS